MSDPAGRPLFVVLDASVIRNTPVFESLARCDVTIVVPAVAVIEVRWPTGDRARFGVTHAVRSFWASGSPRSGICLRTGGRLIVDERIDWKDDLPPGMGPSRDNLIVMAARRWQKLHPNGQVVLLSFDRALRRVAETRFGVRSVADVRDVFGDAQNDGPRSKADLRERRDKRAVSNCARRERRRRVWGGLNGSHPVRA